MLRLEDIIHLVKSYNPYTDMDLIQRAYVFSAKVHAGQIRKSGEPFLMHPLEVAKILAELKLDDASICTALLHDTVEDTSVKIEDIEKFFGSDIAFLVDGVTKISQIKFQSTEEKLAENFRKMIIAMSRDIRVILVKLSDRLHNMRTLGHLRADKQEQIALETLEIYAPLANRLGLGWVKYELEDLCFKYLRPLDYQDLSARLGKTQKERSKFIQEVSHDLSETLARSDLHQFEVSGRPKHLWSIFRKMVDKGLRFEDIYDLTAFRVVVDKVNQCYEVLGYVHALWRPIPARFKDYIAMPKPNRYQSLHTTLIGPHGERIEIQIRTQEMHEIAELGVAAHWKYKAEGGKPVKVTEAIDKGFIGLRQLLNWQHDLQDPREFLDSVKLDLFKEEVFVFTPKGDVIELPKGATPLDFAFAIHSEIGSHCVSAKVNNRIVPLRYVLENGDACAILTQKNQTPNKSWLEFVKTSRARTKIRAFLRQIEQDRAKQIGRELLEKELKRFSLTLDKFSKNLSKNTSLKDQGFKNLDDIFYGIGYGKLESKKVVEKCIPEELRQNEQKEKKENRLLQFINRLASKNSPGIKIEGIENLLVHYARCCSPVKDEPVIGFVTRGRGLSIHRYNCVKIFELAPERQINVTWDSAVHFERSVFIRVVTYNREGMLSELAGAFNQLNMSILEANCKTYSTGQGVTTFKCNISDWEHLNKLIRLLKSIKGVYSVERTYPKEE